MLKKIKQTIFNELAKGLTPKKIAQSLSFGIIIGIFPLLGLTTLLAFIIGHAFKLNHAILQSVNYVMYPIQIILIPIYIKFAAYILSIPDVPIRPDIIIKLFISSPWNFIRKYSIVAVGELIIWTIVGVILYFALIKILIPIIANFQRQKNE